MDFLKICTHGFCSYFGTGNNFRGNTVANESKILTLIIREIKTRKPNHKNWLGDWIVFNAENNLMYEYRVSVNWYGIG